MLSGNQVNLKTSGKIKTPVADIPVLPVIILGIGFYLLWYGIHYFETGGWPTDPVKSVLQGKGVPPVGTRRSLTAIENKDLAKPQSTTPSTTPGGSSDIAQQASTYNNNANNPKKYVWGGAPGTTKGQLAGTDCSGFVNAVIGRDLDYAIPGLAAGKYDGSNHGPVVSDWANATICTTTTTPTAGDIVCYGSEHMGIMVDSTNMISDTDPTTGTITQAAATGGPGGQKPLYRSLNADSGPGNLPPGEKGGTPTANQNLAKLLAANYGWSTGQNWDDLVKLWTQESGWSQTATNPSSGAYGIAQALPPTKYPTKGQAPPVGTSDPTTQISWGLQYIKTNQNFSDPSGAWAHEQQFNWY